MEKQKTTQSATVHAPTTPTYHGGRRLIQMLFKNSTLDTSDAREEAIKREASTEKNQQPQQREQKEKNEESAPHCAS